MKTTSTNSSLTAAAGIALAITLTAGLAAVSALELQRSFDPAPVERSQIQVAGRRVQPDLRAAESASAAWQGEGAGDAGIVPCC